MESIILSTKDFVTDLFRRDLPAGMDFHNLKHTREVVSAATRIGKGSGLDSWELELLQVAAWLHDCGYCYTYKEHEYEGVLIATGFLTGLRLPADYISQVNRLIEVTRMPQAPTNLLEQIICDADLAHLAKANYPAYAERLRSEWKNKLNKEYTDAEWNSTNLRMLQSHQYFTGYGKSKLQPGQHKNAALLTAAV